MATPSTTTVIYTRISKDREGRKLGTERQEALCRELAERFGLTISRVFPENDISASTLSRKRRPEYEEMMALAEAGQIGTILAYSNSRLTRRPLELERLIKAHDKTSVRFRTVVSGDDDLSTADGRMIARIKASVDAAESERISERVLAQKEQAIQMGEFLGGWRPFGLEKDGRTVRDSEAEVIKDVTTKIINGASMTSLVKSLNEAGVLTSVGGAWSSRTLRRVVMRPHPSVDPDVTTVVRAILNDPKRRTTPGPARRWMLSGCARCGVCGGPLRGSGSSLGAGRGTYPAYRCPTGKHIVVSAVTLDAFISDVVLARLYRPDAAKLFETPKVDTAALHNRARVLRGRLDVLADDLDIDERTLARRSQALNAELETVEQQITEAARMSPLGKLAGEDPADVWQDLDVDARRDIIDVLMTVTVGRTRAGVVPREYRWRADLPAFDPRRVVITWR